MKKTFYRAAQIAAALAIIVVVMGAYVRLSDAGLGCPDWPGCYGQLSWPASPDEIARATSEFPERPAEPGKAWREMAHRYVAGLLGLLVAFLAIMAFRNRKDVFQPVILPGGLLLLVIFQALLGMWTVTLLLKPGIVMAHLLGGVATFSLLAWLSLRSNPQRADAPPASAVALKPWIIAAISLLVIQIALGGWTSANYAALSCPDFPTCMGQWWPQTDFREGFVLWRGVGVDYEGGVLDHPARVAIHLSHRIGAIVMLLFLGGLSIKMIRTPALDLHGRALLFLLLMQIGLGIMNVQLQLPLFNAVAHSAGASMLMLCLITSLHRTVPRRRL